MKRSILNLSVAILTLSCLASCGEKAKEEKAPVKQQTALKTDALPGYRFVNMDSISLKYGLSIDFNEQMIKLQNNYSEEEKRQTNALNTKGEALQKKMQAAQQQATQPSQGDMEAMQKDYESLQNMQEQAQQKLAKMNADMQQTFVKNSQTVVDSVKNFLKDYALKHGYEAVFISDAAGYYDPALDVTDEVIEGLNQRYNKVK